MISRTLILTDRRKEKEKKRGRKKGRTEA